MSEIETKVALLDQRCEDSGKRLEKVEGIAEEALKGVSGLENETAALKVVVEKTEVEVKEITDLKAKYRAWGIVGSVFGLTGAVVAGLTLKSLSTVNDKYAQLEKDLENASGLLEENKNDLSEFTLELQDKIRNSSKTAIQSSVSPVGSVIPWIGNIPDDSGLVEPTKGWLLCNGEEIVVAPGDESAEKYESLGVLMGGETTTRGFTFKLPDLRNEFLRGATSERRPNSRQPDSVGPHSHTMHGEGRIGDPIGGFLGRANDAFSESGGSNFGTGGGVGADANNRMRTGEDVWMPNADGTVTTETRPRNTAVWFLIKY